MLHVKFKLWIKIGLKMQGKPLLNIPKEKMKFFQICNIKIQYNIIKLLQLIIIQLVQYQNIVKEKIQIIKLMLIKN